MQDILYGLNEQQSEAVTATEGYVRVIAGAGSGKTKALTHRYAYLVSELGIASQNILCLTFTNKAAKEMKTRIKRLLGDEYDTSFVATLHSFCTRILREDIGRLFYPESFIVMDVSDQKRILEEIYDELGIRMDTASFQFMIDKIKYFKNYITYCDYVLVPSADIASLEPKNMEEKVIFRYIQKQKKYFGLDFFDLINFVIYLFSKHADILEKWQNRLHYVMVDEFQDITYKEFKLIRSLTEINQNFFVVGDPDQNIYEWRGSRMEVLQNFEENVRKFYENKGLLRTDNVLRDNFKTILMNQNYRSTPEILAASNSMVAKNVNRIEKELYTSNPSGEPAEHFHGKTEAEEMAYISRRIKEHAAEGIKFSDMAVLYRSSHVSRFVEQGLLRENIPYIVYGGVGFYERMEIKDVLSYLRLVAYESDDLSFQRVVNVPRRKFGKTKMRALKVLSAAEGLPLYTCLKKHLGESEFSGSGVRNFVDAMEEARELASSGAAVSEVLQRLLISSGYELYIRESGDMDRLDNVSELVRSIVQIEADWGERLPLERFLEDVALHAELDGDDGKNAVRIMTIHTAKGLEFPVVCVAGMSEGTFPSARALEERKEEALEEERRLCFVAMNRAKRSLYLTESEGMGFRGWAKAPSRFLFDIGEAYVRRVGDIPQSALDDMRARASERKPSASERYEEGCQVKHKVFGEGIVERVDEKTRTYVIRFMQGVKPINFDYQGLSRVF